MPLPTFDEFREILLQGPLEKVVQDYIFEGDPYAFQKRPQDYDKLRTHLCNALGLPSRGNVTIIGSGKLGFSLNPDNFGRQFSGESDIDVAVIDASLFDQVWEALLRWNYPRRFHLLGLDWDWAKLRKEELYWGWFRPDKVRFTGLTFPEALKPLRNVSTRWFTAFRSLARVQDLADREVSGRLYRTWNHALLYHTEGLRQVTEAIRVRIKETQ